MAKGKDQHVTPHADGWQVKGEGNKRATVVTGTKKEAVDAGGSMLSVLGTLYMM